MVFFDLKANLVIDQIYGGMALLKIEKDTVAFVIALNRPAVVNSSMFTPKTHNIGVVFNLAEYDLKDPPEEKFIYFDN